MFKVNNRDSRKRCEICSNISVKTPERRRSGVFTVNLELISTASIAGFEQVSVSYVLELFYRNSVFLKNESSYSASEYLNPKTIFLSAREQVVQKQPVFYSYYSSFVFCFSGIHILRDITSRRVTKIGITNYESYEFLALKYAGL